jgi:hypothetical protein
MTEEKNEKPVPTTVMPPIKNAAKSNTPFTAASQIAPYALPQH